MNDPFGLKQGDLDIIVSVIQIHEEVTKAYLFGSRAKGTSKNGSDVDVALKGKNLSTSVVLRISYQLNEETTLPYKFDVLNYHTISNDELKKHIDRVGVCIYLKENGGSEG